MWNFPRGIYGIPCEVLHVFSTQTGPNFIIQTPRRLHWILKLYKRVNSIVTWRFCGIFHTESHAVWELTRKTSCFIVIPCSIPHVILWSLHEIQWSLHGVFIRLIPHGNSMGMKPRPILSRNERRWWTYSYREPLTSVPYFMSELTTCAKSRYRGRVGGLCTILAQYRLLTMPAVYVTSVTVTNANHTQVKNLEAIDLGARSNPGTATTTFHTLACWCR